MSFQKFKNSKHLKSGNSNIYEFKTKKNKKKIEIKYSGTCELKAKRTNYDQIQSIMYNKIS